MKKLRKQLLVAVLVLSLTACGSSEKSVSGSEAASGQASNAVVSSAESQESVQEIAFEEYTAVDNDECSIKITGIEPDNVWGYTVAVQLENKNQEKTYMFSVESAAINGVQADPLFATEVAPGKKANGDITFADSALKSEVGDYTQIELTFRVYDGDDWTAEPVAYETVYLYPYGEAQAQNYVRDAQANDVILIDNDKVSVVALNYELDNIWGFTVNLYLVNKTDAEVMFSVDDASVNGYMMDPFFAKTVLPGKSAFTSLSWANSSLKDNGIESVQEIEMRVRAYDADNWMGDDFANEVVTLNT